MKYIRSEAWANRELAQSKLQPVGAIIRKAVKPAKKQRIDWPVTLYFAVVLAAWIYGSMSHAH